MVAEDAASLRERFWATWRDSMPVKLRDELIDSPPKAARFADFPPEQSELRRDIAKHLCRMLHHLQDSRPLRTAGEAGEVQPARGRLRKRYPMYGKYVNQAGNAVRVLGVVSEHPPVLRTFEARLLGSNVKATTPADKLRRVKEYPPHVLEVLRDGLVLQPGVFLDPLGFVILIRN